MTWRPRISRPEYAALCALVVLVVGNAAFTPHFATAGNLWNVLMQVSTVMLVAVGMTFVIATGGVDLSVGSAMAIGAAIAAVLMDRGPAVAIPAAIVGAALVGVLNGVLIAPCACNRSSSRSRRSSLAAGRRRSSAMTVRW